jgi:ribosomal-protein-alanine N-acetyltransferase
MTEADLDEVLQVEFRAYAFPWSRGIFRDCLKSGYDCRVLCIGRHVVGHSVLTSAAGEAHLLNVCIRRDQQGQGLGRLFVRHALKRAAMLGATVLYLEVRPTNRIARRLYESLGFVEVGVRKDYYPSEQGREDALVLARQL